MTTNIKGITWDTTYDVIVLGFGGAGATAARFAADAGAKVLLADAAPSGHEGGNTRYAAQLIGTGDDFEGAKKYYQGLTAPMKLDETMIDTFVHGMVGMRDYVKTYLGVEPVSSKHDLANLPTPIPIEEAIYEYPEIDGVKSYDFTTVHNGIFDAALWRLLREKVVDRMDKIDVWFSSPAQHLIQDPDTNMILGVQIKHHGKIQNIRANNGVVMAMGGFENNQQDVQDYLGAEHVAVLGTLYNKGDGLRMAQEVGADLWHMSNYEALGFLHGMAFKPKDGERARLQLAPGQSVFSGSVITVADDGSRYFKEDESQRHGHIYDHGTWRIPRTNVHPHLVFDQAQYDQFMAAEKLPDPDFKANLVHAASVAELAALIDASPEILQATISNFNHFATVGTDYAFNRAPETMRTFDEGPYYAIELTNVVLNTQGGPRRNAHAEILDTNQRPIPHLYGAGELGGISTNQYQAGGNLAECLIFGKIAGENAAKAKEPGAATVVLDAISGASQHEVSTDNDLAAEASLAAIELTDNQFLGTSANGIGGQVVVRITYADNRLENVEVMKESETGEVGGKAMETLPAAMVAANTYDVDGVSGASVSSNAIKDAVKDALSKVQN
ncbi:FAD-binding protein [Furfurilactobacillus siliginis]|uniref:Urocanate reductase n=1 Tax=Furfurilactobacillus siliginis TaxID=348151 RepID=A0A0R2L753_9LACO|nr:FAD-binding protein [Furfurilactobacillus siliginis]KRN97232.1 fumarate reductase, flavoprotein subunit [Furfurilactobacillus siliginis]GEK29452.1 fumarate reductase [Furfurilactobacillus siliginis]